MPRCFTELLATIASILIFFRDIYLIITKSIWFLHSSDVQSKVDSTDDDANESDTKTDFLEVVDRRQYKLNTGDTNSHNG